MAERGAEERPVDAEPSRLTGKEARDQGGQHGASLKDVDVRETLVSDQQEGALKDLFNARPTQAVPDARRNSPSSPSAGGASSLGTSPLILGKGLGGAEGSSFSGGASPLLDGGRRNTPLGPPAAGPALPSRSTAVGGGGGFLGSGSGFQNSFGGSSSLNNNNPPRNDSASGSSRRTFDTPRR